MRKIFSLLFAAILGTVCLFSAIPRTSVRAEDYFYAYTNTYSPSTGVISPPAIVAEIDDFSSYSALDTEKTPSIALYRINESLQVIDQSGSVIAELSDAIRNNPNIIPAVRIENETQQSAFLSFVSSTNLRDAYAVSSDANIIKTIAAETSTIMLVVDFTKNKLQETADIRSICASSNALIALLDSDDADEIAYLNARLQSVWVTTGSKKTEIFTLMNTGAQGIVTSAPDRAIEILESITEPALLGRKFTIGHRGSPAYGENTLTSALEAFSQGCDAVECDIQLTKDNEIVLMHDDTIDRTTNGSGTVSEMTLEELQQYTVSKSGEKIPSATEYLTGLKDVNGVIVIEYKRNVTEIVPLIKEIIYNLEIENNVVFLSSYFAPMQLSRELMPEIPVFFGTSDKNTAFNYAIEYNCHIHYTYTQSDEQTEEFLQSRGIFVNTWTYQDKTAFDKNYVSRTNFLTVDTPSLGTDYITSCDSALPQFSLHTESESPLPIVGSACDKFGVERDTALDILYIDGSADILASGSSFYGSDNGYAYVAVKYTSPLGYTVFSNPIPVLIGSGTLPVETVEPPVDSSSKSDSDLESLSSKDSGCGSSSGKGIFLPFAAFCTVIIFKKKTAFHK